MRVAILGTGVMGSGMARSLLRDGHSVSVWNRTAGRAAPLGDDGARVADSAAAAVTGSDVVVTMLFDADSVIGTVGSITHEMSDAVWVQSSTIGTEGTARVAELASTRGIAVLDAPVLGTKQPAETGNLVMLVSGDHGLLPRAQAVFDAVGSRVVWAGDTLGDASALKLACNAWVASLTAATAQSLALARSFGLDPRLFLDAISGGAVDSAYAHIKGTAMLSGATEPSFALDGVVKDLGLITDAAERHGVDPSVLRATLDRFRAASAAGYGDQDMAAVVHAFSDGFVTD